jgi:hypothetical protein
MIMSNRFSISIWLWALLILGLSTSFSYAENQNYYVINVYGRADSGSIIRQVRTAFVDLDLKAVKKSIRISDSGEIVSKKSILIKGEKDTLLVSIVNMGGMYLNSDHEGERAKIVFINPKTQSLINSRIDTGLSMIYFLQQTDTTAYIWGYWDTVPQREISGFFILGRHYYFHKVRPEPPDYSPDLFSGSGPCELFYLLSPEENLYRADCWKHYAIVKTNSDRTEIFDSLIIPFSLVVVDSIDIISTAPDRAHIFAVKDTLLYDFNLNYETYQNRWVKRYGQGWIKNHVNIYDNRTFALLDSMPVPDYPKGDYIDGPFDVADIIGPYIVYYFFESESREFAVAPAMLFIFDTRTNQATWLRVGWR